MPNGTGKTTTLNLLKATLTGEAKGWGYAKIKEFRRPGDATSTGHFQVELRVDERPLALGLELDFEFCQASYTTRSPEVGGFNPDWPPPPAVRRFLSRKFVDLFIFDGELANRLLNPNESRAEEAIEALCQLDLLDDIQAQVRTFWEEQARIAGGASTATGLARYKGIAGRLNARLADLRTELSDADSRLDVIARRRNDLEQKIRQHLDADENGREARDKTRLAKAGVDEEVNAAVLEVLTRLRRPESLSGAFTRTLRTMKSHLDRLKLPESTSRQFFTELAEDELCICGRPLSEHERQFILSRAEDFLGNDIMSTLNSLKTDIDRLSDSEAESALTSAVENLGNLRGKARTLATELEQLENQSFSNASEELVAARTELTELDKEAFKLVERRSKLVGPATREDAQLLKQGSEVSNTVSIKAAERRLEAVNREIARITGTVELKAKIKVLEAILTDARETAQRYIRDVLVGSCNEKLRQVLKGDPIQLKTIDKSLVLEGRDRVALVKIWRWATRSSLRRCTGAHTSFR